MVGQRPSVTLEEICVEDNLAAEEAEQAINKLVSQALIIDSSDKISIREDLRHLVDA
jgi:hypothetical protein